VVAGCWKGNCAVIESVYTSCSECCLVRAVSVEPPPVEPWFVRRGWMTLAAIPRSWLRPR